jgi:hypothetical protein
MGRYCQNALAKPLSETLRQQLFALPSHWFQSIAPEVAARS